MKSWSLRTLVTVIGSSVAIVTALSVPAGHWALGYMNLASLLDYKADLNARYLAKYIYTHDTLWQYQRVRLADLLEQTNIGDEPGRKRVVDSAGNLVLVEGPPIASPTIIRSSPIIVSGASVGRIEIEASLRGLLIGTGQVAMLSVLLGFGIYFALRAFPLKVLDRTLGALESTNRRFDAALNNMSHGLSMFDSEQRLLICNRRFLAIFGLTPDLITPGMPFRQVVELARNGVLRESTEEIVEQKERMLAEGARSIVLRELSDGRVLSIMHEPIADGGWLTTYEDITERREAESKIKHMARHDGLTDLPNRLLFREQMEEILGHLSTDERVAVLSLDLDHFKEVNDTLGHPIGDNLLKAVATRLRQCVRDSDIVARLGGDEFAIVQTRTDLAAAEVSSLASRLVDVISAPYDIDGHQVVIAVSIGITIAPTDGTDPDQLLRNADMALYRAKFDGRSTYRFFEAEMDARARARRLLELELRDALKKGEFEVYYQPIVELCADEVVGFEALVRWHHPQRGIILPAEFIAVTEETGLIVPLGEWVLRQACADAATWSRGVRVAVNLSPAQFKNRNLVPSVISAIAAAGLAPERLELEITETILLQDSEATLAALHSLRNFGVRISMDDFGTGYSSLNYLRSFPFDKIKIDRSFIHDMSSRDDSMAIVRAVTGLGKSLGIATTAEGVETIEQLGLLRLEGCCEAQGYLFSPPRPAAEVEGLLSSTAKRAVA